MTETESHPLTPQDCLVLLMFSVSVSDTNIRTSELIKIENQVNTLPIFGTFDIDRITVLSNMVFDLFSEEDGLDALFGLVHDNLPEKLNETAYALCCDVAAADGILREGEIRLLEEIRDQLNIDRLYAAAIERGARARHMTV
ncbi:MAG: tellurite resistance TerB family protein [Pseudooceanicola atlanticus]